MANAEGGVIVLGVQTVQRDESFVDAADHLRLLPATAINAVQYTSITADRVYPTMREIDVRFYASAADPDHGLFAIEVPKQSETDRYFLIQRPLGSDAKSWIVGLAIRSIGRVEPRRAGEIHGLINRGLGVGRQLADLAEGLAELRELVEGGGAPPAQTAADRLDDVLQQRVDEIDA